MEKKPEVMEEKPEKKEKEKVVESKKESSEKEEENEVELTLEEKVKQAIDGGSWGSLQGLLNENPDILNQMVCWEWIYLLQSMSYLLWG